MTPRRALTQKQKAEVLRRQKDRCADCGKALVSGLYQFDHIQALEHGGDNAMDNWRALCTKPCHADKTKRDHGDNAKVRAVRFGKARKGPPMMGSRNSPWKRLMSGEAVRR